MVFLRNISDNIRLRLLCLLCLTFLLIPVSTVSAQNKPSQNNLLDEIIIIFKSDMSLTEQNQILDIYQNDVTVLEQIEDYALCKLNNTKDTSNILKSLNENPYILVAESNSEIELQGITNDSYSDSQWPLKNNGYYYHVNNSNTSIISSTQDIDLNIPKAWSIYSSKNMKEKEVVIAILDTGVDINHPDLVGRIWINQGEIPGDGIDNDNNGYIDDMVGWDFYNNDDTVCHYQYNSSKNMDLASPKDNDDHGTHIAGIIAANANNKIGIAGVASNINVKIMSLKIHGGANGKGTVANAIKAIKYATMMGADICNMSWGSTSYSAALETAMQESTMLFVTAAGNSGTNNDTTPLYPASYNLDNQISVSFIDADGALSKDSNYGKQTVDIAAPGTNIISTTVGSYGTMSGSSMAAPHVSAIAAMLYTYSDNLYASDVKNIIVNNIKYMEGLENFTKNPGIPNAAAIVASMEELQPDNTLPDLQLSTRYEKDRILIDINADGFDGSGIRTIRYIIGERSTDYFKRGTIGLGISDNILSLAKAGTYTFYISDYAGNETSQIYEVLDDTEAPTINSSYKVSGDYSSITITASITDLGSGVKTAKYLTGVKTIDDFRSINSGTAIKLENDTGVFEVTTPGRYTIYAQDYRGNKVISYVNAKIIKSTALSLNRLNKTLGVGKFFRLWPSLGPDNSTDQVTYVSSNPSVVTVSKWGLLKGISPGKATITATTSSGIKRTCVVTVKYPKE